MSHEGMDMEALRERAGLTRFDVAMALEVSETSDQYVVYEKWGEGEFIIH